MLISCSSTVSVSLGILEGFSSFLAIQYLVASTAFAFIGGLTIALIIFFAFFCGTLLLMSSQNASSSSSSGSGSPTVAFSPSSREATFANEVKSAAKRSLKATVRTVSSNASSQKIGFLEFDTFRASDIQNWLQLIGQSSYAKNISEVNVDGGVATPGPGESEVLLDIEAAISGAQGQPGVNYVVYDAPPSASFQSGFNAMINDGDTVISNSWSACEDEVSEADAESIDSVLAQAAASGITVVNGSGDTGSTCLDGSPDTIGVPADSPHALAVGGTTAVATSQDTYSGNQVYWSSTDGQGGYGTSRYFTRPTYQNALNSSDMRSVPDVAAIADPTDGLGLCQSDAGGCPNGLEYGGTSMAAPEVAGEIALLNVRVGTNLGEANTALYPLSGTSAFQSATAMGSDFANVGLGALNLPSLALALTGATAGTVSASSRVGAGAPAPADGSSPILWARSCEIVRTTRLWATTSVSPYHRLRRLK